MIARGRRWSIAVVGVVALLATGSRAFAEDDAFKEGLQQSRDAKWVEAAASMRRAIEEKGTESARKVKWGGRFGIGTQETVYVPYYYLGLALFKSGDCAGAIEAWSISEQQAIVKSAAAYAKQIQDGYADCSRRGFLAGDEFRAQVTAATEAIMRANAVANRIRNEDRTYLELWQLHQEWNQQYQSGAGQIEIARTRYAAATRTRLKTGFQDSIEAAQRAYDTLAALETAVTSAVQAVKSLLEQARLVEQLIASASAADAAIDGLRVSLPPAVVRTRTNGRALIRDAREKLGNGRQAQSQRMLADARSTAQDAAAALDQALAAAKQIAEDGRKRELQDGIAAGDGLFATIDALLAALDGRMATAAAPADAVAQREKLRKQLETARRRFGQAQNDDNLAALQQAVRSASESRTQLEALLGSFGPLTLRDRGVPGSLEDAVRLFTAGEYEKVIATLDAATLASAGPFAAHGQVLRAASLFTLFVRSGEKNQKLLADARAAVAECRSRWATFQPDRRLFAPRFLAFFENPGVAAQRVPAATHQ